MALNDRVRLMMMEKKNIVPVCGRTITTVLLAEERSDGSFCRGRKMVVPISREGEW